ncbi:hypothetical protein BJY00DRAFT_280388 [Aspergillus carlsbadensis]|nr:hypothetical protein BJY00DRAFT_280388 [Aspergillus carlsbadensis]
MDSTGDPSPFFGAFDLPWEAGESHSYSLWKFNVDCSIPDGAMMSWLPDPCGMSVISVKNVSLEERIYVPHEEAALQLPADDTEAAVAGAHVGKGYFVYVGDLNWEMGSELIVMALIQV